MANNVVLTNFDYTYNGQLTDEVLLKPALQHPDLTKVFTVAPQINSKRQLNMVDQLGYVIKADDGSCGTRTITGDAAKEITNRTLEVADLEVYLEQCSKTFKDTILEEKLKTGSLERDLTGTEIQSKIINPLVVTAISRNIFDLMSFGEVGGSGGAYFTPLDGLWTRMIDGLTDYTVNECSGTFGSTLAADEAIDAFNDMWDNSEIILKQTPKNELKLFVTGSVYENYRKTITALGIGVSESWSATQNGVGSLAWNGIEVVPIWGWDATIAGQGFSNPHRALLTTPSNHIVGIQNPKDTASFSAWYDRDEKQTKMEAAFKMGYQYKFGGLQTICI